MKFNVVSHKASALKSIIWRVMGIIVLASVTYFFTRRLITTTQITITHHAFFLLVFYLHERLWIKIKRVTGRLRNVIKAFTYEIILGMGFGGLIVYFYTGSFPLVGKITTTYTLIKLVMYFFFDKAWPEFKKEK